jgi:RNA polymerase sigma-70 factor (ECF subfamily)
MTQAETRKSARSFDQVYDQYKTSIYTYIYYLLGDREQAESLTQEVFLEAFRTLATMDTNEKPSVWLYCIVTGALARHHLIVLPPQDLAPASSSADSGALQEQSSTPEPVYAALERVPEPYRAMLLLRTQAGFSYSEIAQILSIAVSDVKTGCSRARQSFREHYRAPLPT